MRMTDLIIKRFYHTLNDTWGYVDDSFAGEGEDNKALFTQICYDTMKLGQVCEIGDDELDVLFHEMQCAALDQMEDVLDPFEALDAVIRSTMMCQQYLTIDERNSRASVEQSARMSQLMIKWFYRWLEDKEDCFSLTELEMTFFESACDKLGRLLRTCRLQDDDVRAVFTEMKCAALERLQYTVDPFAAIGIVTDTVLESCHE